ncbi:hypothetical protein EX30DRAFT_110942 [Ascodesmis nigricans]|uniref:REJ domain-containing protein n=1 Tax=Ascodesmis nigricans TaxID=341454 RepID=A0A4V3SIA9_9PEZI|nr:hypothetical protein EX30DRAFT_110942 [Ascodesmis nigricans]
MMNFMNFHILLSSLSAPNISYQTSPCPSPLFSPPPSYSQFNHPLSNPSNSFPFSYSSNPSPSPLFSPSPHLHLTKTTSSHTPAHTDTHTAHTSSLRAGSLPHSTSTTISSAPGNPPS